MNLTYYTNYSLRVVIYLGLHSSALASITQISAAFGISRNHLVKVVHHLARLGFIKTARGRGGGLRLAREPAKINIGDLVRQSEPGFRMVECFDKARNTCPLTPVCRLKGIVLEAENAFLGVLDGYSLADLLGPRRAMAELLGITLDRRAPLWRSSNHRQVRCRPSRTNGRAVSHA
ncbi:MAG: Rrf2 family transcriptional regulator [Phycisphaerae bacterium]|jgi:Rrf2 family nitric oxide-sensitive transcriptional repressor